MKDEVKDWWKQAKKDLNTAKFNLKGRKYEPAAFFCQQSVEKALKAMYIKKFKKLKKTHDLVLLARDLDLPEDIIDTCKDLTPAYTYTRYPDVVRIKNIKKVSEELIDNAEGVLKWIKKNL